MITVSHVLTIEPLTQARVVAGESGLDNVIEHVDIIEVPDADAWIRPGSFLLTTAFAFKEDPGKLFALIEHLGRTKASALALKPHRFLGCVPQEAVNLANKHCLPLIEVPAHLAYIDITTPIMTLIIDEQSFRLKRSETVHRVLTDLILGGGGLSEIAVALHSLLKNPVIVLSPDLTVLAEVPSHCTDGNLRGDVTAGLRQLSKGRCSDVNLPQRIILGGSRSAVVAAVVAGREVCGYLAVPEENRNVPDTEWLALEKASTAIALDLMRQKAVAEAEHRMEHDLVMDILSGPGISEDIARERAKYFSWRLGGNVGVAVVDIDDFTTYYHSRPKDETHIQKMKDSLFRLITKVTAEVSPDAIVTRYSDGAVLLFTNIPPASETWLDEAARSIHNTLSEHIDGPTCSLGVGGVYSQLSDLWRSFSQAQKAMEIGRLINGKNTVHCYNTLGIYRLICDYPDREALKEIVKQTIGPLIEYDRNNNGSLIETLHTYLACDKCQKTTSERLYLHRNSVKYRLQLIRDLLGDDAFAGFGATRIHLALAIHMMLSRHS